MLNNEFMVLLDAFRRLMRRNAKSSLIKIINKTHSADLAALFRNFSDLERENIFDLLTDNEYKAELLSELDVSIMVDLLKNQSPENIVDILKCMAQDDKADIVAELPGDLEQAVLDLMNKSESENLEELMMHAPESAGGIMVPLPFKMYEDDSVQDAIKVIQENRDLEMVFYIYVVDKNEVLSGVLSVRQLLSVAPDSYLKDVMSTKVITVFPETDQEEVARMASRYDFLALPVVDRDNKLLGIVTVDDIIDVIREEATEDFLQMAGVGKDREILLKPSFEAAKIRFPWLFATFFGGFIVSLIVMKFENLINEFIILAAFMPVVAGMGGNLGAQSSTIVVRGIATGRINVKQIGKVFLGQFRIGIILGLVYGLLLTLFSFFMYHQQTDIIKLNFSIGVSLTLAMIIAAATGTLVPILLERIHIDPAVATGPIVSTINDIFGVTVYYYTAILLLR